MFTNNIPAEMSSNSPSILKTANTKIIILILSGKKLYAASKSLSFVMKSPLFIAIFAQISAFIVAIVL